MVETNDKKTIGMRITELLGMQDKLQRDISNLKEKLDRVTQELNTLADQIKAPPAQGSHKGYFAHDRETDKSICISPPPKGIVTDMIKVMQEFNAPMKADSIYYKVVKIRPETKPASIRSYLTNLDYFENVKLKDIKAGKTSYTSPGWVLSEKGKSVKI